MSEKPKKKKKDKGDPEKNAENILEKMQEKYPNGDIYKGFCKVVNEVKVPHSKGIMTYANTDLYDGNWFEGKKHGLGVRSNVDGSSYEGHY